MSPALESEPRSPRERMGSGKAVKEGDFFPTDFITGPKVPQNLEPKGGVDNNNNNFSLHYLLAGVLAGLHSP